MKLTNKVLLIDDDPGIIEVLKLYFEKEGYQVFTCMQGDKAVATYNSTQPDIIILDLMLPGTDGNDICREIRKTSEVPIIMLTARTDTLDKIIGLELGADDYIPKPFESKEVLARVKAVLRRTEKRDASPVNTDESKSADVITYTGFSVDKIRYVVTVDGKEIYMPPKELELLFFLASNPNRVFTREQLLENVWGYDFYGESRTVDVHIKRIREKIENPDREQNWCIKTVWSKGYKFETR
ncbi:MAG: response regulator transcription factor [Saccharofermentans sp.]|jgi:DNA-binding response OmpR family regulator|nr:response regulator transcription factor [Mageeibacillus sp.]MCI1263606.1 response regulator transcription factor [Saccharofermentans sp.]MCI1275483.1 response regulator transcription factor [Saccharofermentans sp.]MCI1769383.1 response regulator transcription factor [Mageeibacillus sp.]MCI2044488.1 response regulator transcription factor [Mageeibacillus sp.]